ncbi:hypothetical protein QBC39DRAFT_3916 [Podospora conica]|nr:hypothetical protein QBC39DRAFT_3916 [Schizothecium conicum]
MHGVQDEVWRRLEWETVPGTLSPGMLHVDPAIQTPTTTPSFGSMDLVLLPRQLYPQQPDFVPYMGTSATAQPIETSTYQVPTLQYASAPWDGHNTSLIPSLHGPFHPETFTAPMQIPITTSPSQQDSKRCAQGRKKAAYLAYHRAAGTRSRQKKRDNTKNMEAATRDMEQAHASLIAREKALTEERLVLREELYKHARMCNDERIVKYLASTAGPIGAEQPRMDVLRSPVQDQPPCGCSHS